MGEQSGQSGAGSGQGPHLAKALSTGQQLMIALGFMAPAIVAYIYMPILYSLFGTFSWLAALIGTAMVLPVMLCYAELGSAWPLAGCEYSMVGRVLGRGVGFVLFILTFLIYFAIGTIGPLGAGWAAAAIWPAVDPHLVAVLCIVAGMAVGFFKVSVPAKAALIAVIIQMAIVAVVVVMGFWHAHGDVGARLISTEMMGADGVLTPITFSFALAGIGVAIGNMGGFQSAIVFGEESIDARKHMGRVMVIVWFFAFSVLMIVTTAVFLGVPDLQEFVSSPETGMSSFFSLLGAPWLNRVMNVLVFLAVFEAQMLFIAFCGRQIWSTGRDMTWPAPISRLLATVHPRFDSPWVATTIFGLVLIPMTWLSAGTLLTMVAAVTLLQFLLVCIGVAVVRIRKGVAPEDRWKMPLWPLWVILGVVGTGAALSQQSADALKTVGIAAAASLVYYVVFLVPRRKTHFVLETEKPEISGLAAAGSERVEEGGLV